MSVFYDRFEALCKARGSSPNGEAKKLNISSGSISNWGDGKMPKVDAVLKLAKHFDVSVGFLLGETDDPTPAKKLPDNILPMPKMDTVPLIGTIACGEPILAEENLDGEVSVPEHIKADFALRCKGDSMINARIFDGDIVYIKQQPTVQSGEIAAVLVENEATLKRVKLFSDHISLEPENPMYRPLVFWGEEMNQIRILGKAVAFTSLVR